MNWHSTKPALGIKAKIRNRVLRCFGRDKSGTTAVEFAMIAVPFFGLLMAIFQSGLYFLTSEALDAAVQNAARRLYTGQAQGNNISSAATFVSNYVCPTSGGTGLSSLIDCSKLIVDVRTAPTSGSFANIDTKADFYQAGSTPMFCPGGPNDIVIVRVIYPLSVIVPVLVSAGSGVGLVTAGTVNNVANNPGTKQLLLGTAVFQNEPYANGYVAPAGC